MGHTILVRGIELDNHWVVGHNVNLSTKYDAHINIEVCNNIHVVKYLFKYVYKRTTRTTMPPKGLWLKPMKLKNILTIVMYLH
jgi:hypothetical protein